MWTDSITATAFTGSQNPLACFLPPNIHSSEGQGFVYYTPEWVNTLDLDVPESSVDPLPETSHATFSVSRAGSDVGLRLSAH